MATARRRRGALVRRPVPGREVSPAGEAGDVLDFDQQPGSAGRSDPLERQQRGAGLGEQRLQFPVGGLIAQ
jgi:hypothetical protein